MSLFDKIGHDILNIITKYLPYISKIALKIAYPNLNIELNFFKYLKEYLKKYGINNFTFKCFTKKKKIFHGETLVNILLGHNINDNQAFNIVLDDKHYLRYRYNYVKNKFKPVAKNRLDKIKSNNNDFNCIYSNKVYFQFSKYKKILYIDNVNDIISNKFKYKFDVIKKFIFERSCRIVKRNEANNCIDFKFVDVDRLFEGCELIVDDNVLYKIYKKNESTSYIFIDNKYEPNLYIVKIFYFDLEEMKIINGYKYSHVVKLK